MTHPFTWKNEPVWQRVVRCIRLLSIHGIITETERDKALTRAKKRYRLQQVGSGNPFTPEHSVTTRRSGAQKPISHSDHPDTQATPADGTRRSHDDRQ